MYICTEITSDEGTKVHNRISLKTISSSRQVHHNLSSSTLKIGKWEHGFLAGEKRSEIGHTITDIDQHHILLVFLQLNVGSAPRPTALRDRRLLVKVIKANGLGDKQYGKYIL